VLCYKGILDKTIKHLIPLKQPFQEAEKKTFAHNWLDNMDTVMQLIVSNEIWKRTEDADSNEKFEITQKQFTPKDGLLQRVYYLNEEPVVMLSKSLGDNPEIPLHYTLCI